MSHGRHRRKTEMTGTGGGRWELRRIAKEESDRVRRANDKAEIQDQTAEDVSTPAEVQAERREEADAESDRIAQLVDAWYREAEDERVESEIKGFFRGAK